MLRYMLFCGCIILALCSGVLADVGDVEMKIARLVNEDGLSDALDVFVVDKDKKHSIRIQVST